MKKVGKYEIPSVRACFAMLESLSHHPGGVLLSEIVEAGVLPLASAFRMSVVLENLGYVARDPETKRIRLTDKLLLLGQRALTERGLLADGEGSVTLETSGDAQAVLPVMRRLLERASAW